MSPEKSALCALFFDHQGTITCEVIGSKQYSVDLPQGGLEIPCKLSFHGPLNYLEQVHKLLSSALVAKLDSWCVDGQEKTEDPTFKVDSSSSDSSIDILV
jgi:hypothetical protein